MNRYAGLLPTKRFVFDARALKARSRGHTADLVHDINIALMKLTEDPPDNVDGLVPFFDSVHELLPRLSSSVRENIAVQIMHILLDEEERLSKELYE